MLKSLQLMQEISEGKLIHLRENVWLKYLFLTNEKNVNLEQVESLGEMAVNPVMLYVERTLKVLNDLELPPLEKEIIEEVLVWSEVAKCGQSHKRKEWQERGFQLAIHNVGSAQIYADEKVKTPLNERDIPREELIYTLILTHGLVGQYIRGEVRYRQFSPLIDWVKHHKNSHSNQQETLDIHRLIYSLNLCIIKAVSSQIWENVCSETEEVIGLIADGIDDKEMDLKLRLMRLRQSSIEKGEDFDTFYNHYLSTEKATRHFLPLLRKIDLWYVETALQDFSFEEFIKIFLLIFQKTNPLSLQQISFEPFMKDIYYDYKGKKSINLYKKRIVEAYLKDFSINDLLNGEAQENEHVSLEVVPMDRLNQVVGVKFIYSKAGQKLIEFCQEAEKSPLYERSIILLYDFFGFRKDSFDRLQNEQRYLSEMNSGEDHKKIIADYAIGDLMVDIGAGGGVMLDVLSENHPNARVIGIDISTNVVEDLNKRKMREQKRWEVKQADALDLCSYFKKESVDTIVFSSILHEMYSYIPYKGKQFNIEVIQEALRSSFEILKPGGRIIIRDGIMTEPRDQIRILEFHDPKGMAFFLRYAHDFKGREIKYVKLSENKVKLPVNDAMEFLYTYTWGEESYPHEVQEQFGYATPSEYHSIIKLALGKEAEIVTLQHYLQDGYEEHILPKVRILDQDHEKVRLPDSTCFIVIQKREGKIG